MTARFTVFDRLEEVWVDGSYTNALPDDFLGSRGLRKAARVNMKSIGDGVEVYVERPPNGCPDPDTIWSPFTILVIARRDVVITPDCRVHGIRFFRERIAVFSYGQTYWRRKWVAWDEHTPQPVMRAFGGCSI